MRAGLGRTSSSRRASRDGQQVQSGQSNDHVYRVPDTASTEVQGSPEIEINPASLRRCYVALPPIPELDPSPSPSPTLLNSSNLNPLTSQINQQQIPDKPPAYDDVAIKDKSLPPGYESVDEIAQKKKAYSS